MSWTPLESNPEIMTKYLNKLGVPKKWEISDVVGLDEEGLCWLPPPVVAFILLFPCTDKFYEYRDKERVAIKAKGHQVLPDVFFMKQVIPNACGVIALIHSIANNRDSIELKEGALKEFLDKCASMGPDERGELLQNSSDIINIHKEIAHEGQTQAPDPDSSVNHHFVAVVNVGGSLYELDGREEFAIHRGYTDDENFLKDGAKVCREFIERHPEDVSFSILALTKGSDSK